MRKLRSIAVIALVAGLGPAACVADPMAPCEAFEPGDAADNTVVRDAEGPIAAVAMKDAFLLRNRCSDAGSDAGSRDGSDPECVVEKELLEELSPGSQVMLTSAGRYLVGIDHDDGRVWIYEFDEHGRRIDAEAATYVDETTGPAQLVIGLRDSDLLLVRDRKGRLGTYQPRKSTATPIASDLGAELPFLRLAAVGERWAAVRVTHDVGLQSLYVVDLQGAPDRAHLVAKGDFTSVVFGPGDATVVISEGRGVEASVLVFDVGTRTLLDAFEGDLVSSRERNDLRAVEEVPGMHAISPSGEHIAYRTTSGSLAVRMLEQQSSCLVRNTNRLGTGRKPSRAAGNHAVAGFSADGLLYAEYSVGSTDSFVYAYDPRHQQSVPLGTEEGGWHLAAVPARVTNVRGEVERLWAVGVRRGSHATIGEGRVDGQTIGRELTFMPLADDAVWAVDTQDTLVGPRRSERALSVRKVSPPQWAGGTLRFLQGPDEQVISHYQGADNQGPLRVPLSGRLCLSTGTPGSWAYRCGDSTGTRMALTTDSGTQEQNSEPNVLPVFDPPFPDQGEGGDDPEGPSDKDNGPRRD